MNERLNGETIKQKVISGQLELVETRIENLRCSMNAEIDSLLRQLQQLRELEVKPEAAAVGGGPTKRKSAKVEPTAWEHIPDMLKVKDIQEILKIGRNQAYDLAGSGQFHIIKIGRKMLIPKSGFIDWLEGNTLSQNEWE